MGGLNKAEHIRARASRMGYTPGVPDILIFQPNATSCALAIEMKSARGSVSANQSIFLDALRERGWSAHVCYGWQSAVMCPSRVTAFRNGCGGKGSATNISARVAQMLRNRDMTRTTLPSTMGASVPLAVSPARASAKLTLQTAWSCLDGWIATPITTDRLRGTLI